MATWKVIIDEASCNGCGQCVDVCPSGVLEIVNEKASPTNIDECTGCMSCVNTCPESAITVEEA